MARRPCASEDDTARGARRKVLILLSFQSRGERGTSWSLDKVAAPFTSLAGPLYNFGAIRVTERFLVVDRRARRRWYRARGRRT